MGLDITAYEHITLTEEHEHTDDCWTAEHMRAYVHEEFPRSSRGVEGGRCYTVSGDAFSFRAGSYSGFGFWREALSQAALGVSAPVIWHEPTGWEEHPFFELINFSDCEGTIGPEAAADLARDFTDGAVRAKLAVNEWDAEKWDDWRSAFDLAASTGAVLFH